ncbi:hypothetical protein GUJ93_ZPchr0002g26054 [Zizania palustris]|uniref:Phytocyanin domain-containing protein n=1 Tax=Zizania palustris TaxID=103762 RepID=A0A8J5SNR3_ZIZPA|nr:hypothetical protein GUJ93_ZPchr0002g26054 [Zizania palustris]
MAARAAAAAHIHIEGVQTALPTRVVEPGKARLVAVAAPPLPAEALQRRVRAVLYYRAEDATSPLPCAWEEAVSVKESLSEALADHPEMAGRLRRRADGSWEVKLNDTGVRLLQATAEAPLDEFLADKDLPRKEAALAPWTDVNADDPDMCPPIFMQLTRFQGDGGYAIGVSCALVLSDPLSLARFLLSWARTHARIRAQSKVTPHPMAQYMAYFQRPETSRKRVRSVPLDSLAVDGASAETVLFRARAAPLDGRHRALAAACVDQASEELGAPKVSRFSVVVAPAPAAEDDGCVGKTTIETCTAADGSQAGSGAGAGAGAVLEAVQWSELGLEELMLRDSKPVHVSYRIVTSGDEGLVVVMADGDGSLLVTATLPNIVIMVRVHELAAAGLALLLAAVAPAYAVDYIVGDSSGWASGVDYDSWAKGKTFNVDDSLVFQYSMMHTVAEVSSADYSACSASNSIQSYSDQSTKIALTKPGTRYFICGASGHCAGGMKLAVTVSAADATTPATKSPPSSETPATPSDPGSETPADPSTETPSTPSTPAATTTPTSSTGSTGASGRGSEAHSVIGLLVGAIGLAMTC